MLSRFAPVGLAYPDRITSHTFSLIRSHSLDPDSEIQVGNFVHAYSNYTPSLLVMQGSMWKTIAPQVATPVGLGIGRGL